jgi:hypothetical protein
VWETFSVQYTTANDSRSSVNYDTADDAITQGEWVKKICVSGRLHSLRNPAAQCSDWWVPSRLVGEEEKFTSRAKRSRTSTLWT